MYRMIVRLEIADVLTKKIVKVFVSRKKVGYQGMASFTAQGRAR